MLPPGPGRGALFLAGAAEDALHAVVALVARVLEQLLAGVHVGNRERPRPGERAGIGDGHAVVDLARADAGEALDQLQVLGRAAVKHLVGEVAGLDHERVAVPARHRVAHPLADRPGDVRAPVGRDHARAAQHLDLDRDEAGALGDAVVVVVGRRAHRTRHAAGDAALEGAAIQPGVGATPGGAGAAKGRPLRLVGGAFLRLGRQPRHLAVGRIHDQRRAQAGDLGATVPPEIVVGALHVPARALRTALVAALLLRPLLERRRLLGGEELAAARS